MVIVKLVCVQWYYFKLQIYGGMVHPPTHDILILDWYAGKWIYYVRSIMGIPLCQKLTCARFFLFSVVLLLVTTTTCFDPYLINFRIMLYLKIDIWAYIRVRVTTKQKKTKKRHIEFREIEPYCHNPNP